MTIAQRRRDEPGRGGPSPEGAPEARLEPTGPIMRRTIASLLATAIVPLCSFLSTCAPATAAHRAVPATPVAIAVYARVLRHINPELPGWQSRSLARRVLVNAERWRLDANMLVAIVAVESAWRTHAVSAAGAIGLGQLMPGTAASLKVNPRDPNQNLYGAARYLRGLMQRFGSRHPDLVFAAYNAGPKAVSEYGGIPPYDETESYVVRVVDTWARLSRNVRLPASAYDQWPAHGLDIDYWLNGTENP